MRITKYTVVFASADDSVEEEDQIMSKAFEELDELMDGRTVEWKKDSVTELAEVGVEESDAFKWTLVARGIAAREIIGKSARKVSVARILRVSWDQVPNADDLLMRLEASYMVIQTGDSMFVSIVDPEEMFHTKEAAYYYSFTSFNDIEEMLNV